MRTTSKNKNSSDKKLAKRLDFIQSIFPTTNLLDEIQDNQNIKKYYQASHLAYKFFHNKSGFMHMGLSRNGEYKQEDLFEQLRIISKYIIRIKAESILELGSGNGSNSIFLAREHPEISFQGIDLSKKSFRFSNYHQENGDYHDLKKYKNSSFDLAFAIETICHSNDKKKLLKEVHKKLRPQGLLIIFDGYSKTDNSKLTNEEITAKQLTAKSMAVDNFEMLEFFEKEALRNGFYLTSKEDLSKKVLPTMERLESLALIFFKIPFVIKILKVIMPFDVMKNLIAALLMPMIMKRQIVCYYLHIFRKD